jgi:DNA-binding SARP family transcriptional activator
VVHEIIHLTLLGSFRVRLPGVLLVEGHLATKAAALLKILALRSHHEAHRDELAETLWPRQDASRAYNNVYKAIHHIRSSVGGANGDYRDFVTMRKGIVRLAPWVIVDLDVFVAAAKVARETRRLDAYDGAIALGRLELLPCNRYDDWRNQTHQEVLALMAELETERGNLSAR